MRVAERRVREATRRPFLQAAGGAGDQHRFSSGSTGGRWVYGEGCSVVRGQADCGPGRDEVGGEEEGNGAPRRMEVR